MARIPASPLPHQSAIMFPALHLPKMTPKPYGPQKALPQDKVQIKHQQSASQRAIAPLPLVSQGKERKDMRQPVQMGGVSGKPLTTSRLQLNTTRTGVALVNGEKQEAAGRAVQVVGQTLDTRIPKAGILSIAGSLTTYQQVVKRTSGDIKAPTNPLFLASASLGFADVATGTFDQGMKVTNIAAQRLAAKQK